MRVLVKRKTQSPPHQQKTTIPSMVLPYQPRIPRLLKVYQPPSIIHSCVPTVIHLLKSVLWCGVFGSMPAGVTPNCTRPSKCPRVPFIALFIAIIYQKEISTSVGVALLQFLLRPSSNLLIPLQPMPTIVAFHLLKWLT